MSTGQSTPATGPTDAPAPRATWDAIAADYESLAEPFTRQYAEAALSLAGGVRRGEDVIDVAAGTGALTLAAARAGAHVLGTDFSPGMVARLSSRLKAEQLEGSEARVMDSQALDIADARFDAAFSTFGVILFPDWRRGLAELARVVRPGGRGCVAVGARAEGGGPTLVFIETYRGVFPGAPVPPNPPGVTALADVDTLKAEMERAGFRDVVVDTVGGVFEAASAEWIVENMDRMFRFLPLFTALDEPGKAQMREAFRGAWTQYETPGGIRVPSDAHIAIGRR